MIFLKYISAFYISLKVFFISNPHSFFYTYSAIRRKLLACVYRDYIENEQILENAEPGTNLQRQILQFQEEYLYGVVNSDRTINNILCK